MVSQFADKLFSRHCFDTQRLHDYQVYRSMSRDRTCARMREDGQALRVHCTDRLVHFLYAAPRPMHHASCINQQLLRIFSRMDCSTGKKTEIHCTHWARSARWILNQRSLKRKRKENLADGSISNSLVCVWMRLFHGSCGTSGITTIRFRFTSFDHVTSDCQFRHLTIRGEGQLIGRLGYRKHNAHCPRRS